jgi:hypothetical protein
MHHCRLWIPRQRASRCDSCCACSSMRPPAALQSTSVATPRCTSLCTAPLSMVQRRTVGHSMPLKVSNLDNPDPTPEVVWCLPQPLASVDDLTATGVIGIGRQVTAPPATEARAFDVGRHRRVTTQVLAILSVRGVLRKAQSVKAPILCVAASGARQCLASC